MKVQCLVNGRSTRTSQPSCFCLVIREPCDLTFYWWKIMHFLLTNSRCLSSTAAAFSWSHREQYLLELIVWFSGKSSWEDSLPIPSYKHYLLRMKISLWYGWRWLILLIPQFFLLYIIVQYSLFIAHHKTFSLNVSREMHAEIQSSRFFH